MSVVQNNTISTNSITEVTSANGVTIDGLNVKDNAIVTDTNKYIAIKTGELNSIGFVKNNPNCPSPTPMGKVYGGYNPLYSLIVKVLNKFA